jgi:hypothetical protein
LSVPPWLIAPKGQRLSYSFGWGKRFVCRSATTGHLTSSRGEKESNLRYKPRNRFSRNQRRKGRGSGISKFLKNSDEGQWCWRLKQGILRRCAKDLVEEQSLLQVAVKLNCPFPLGSKTKQNNLNAIFVLRFFLEKICQHLIFIHFLLIIANMFIYW